MKLYLSDWDEDISTTPEEEYDDFVRALKRNEGFALFFVQSYLKESEQLVAKVKKDIPTKNIEVLRLIEPIDNLYDRIAKLANLNEINILFIQGIEYSLYKYEIKTTGNITQLQYDNLTSVPHILNHLNQQRERFRDDFNICFVFQVRSFALRYFIHRAPDFYDWRSGEWQFLPKPETLVQESNRILLEGNYEQYIDLLPNERIKKILEIQELLEINNQQFNNRANLLFELGNLFIASQEYEGAISYFDRAIEISKYDCQLWNNRGVVLSELEHYEEALESYDKAVILNPEDYQAWNNRGVVLSELERYEEALESYDKAVILNPEDYQAWNNRGVVLSGLERYEEALESCDKAVAIEPNYYEAWNNRGVILFNLETYEEALESYGKALKIEPNYFAALNNISLALDKLKRFNEAFESYDKALQFKPSNEASWLYRETLADFLGAHSQGIVMEHSHRYSKEVANKIAEKKVHRSVSSKIKRLIDILGAILGLVITGLIVIPIAIAIKLDSQGPIFFRQLRCGLNGEPFYLWKFRTMVINSSELRQILKARNDIEGGILFKILEDPRITRIGKYLRRTGLDESIQFWNVLKGDMSLVGISPPTPKEVELYTVDQFKRLQVKPGMTGEWQLKGRSNIHDFDEVLRMDMEYQTKWSVGYDLYIIRSTILGFLKREDTNYYY